MSPGSNGVARFPLSRVMSSLMCGSLLLVAITGCDAGARPCRGRVLFEDADVSVCSEMNDDGDGFLRGEHYEVVAREQRSEELLARSDHGGYFKAERLPDGALVVASTWMIAVRTAARTWLKLNVNGDLRADARLRDALRWMVAEPKFGLDGRICAAVNLVELGDPQGADWIARFSAIPDLTRQQRDILQRGRASPSWR